MGVQCVSAGIIFYRNSPNLKFLIQQKVDHKGRCWLEDVGGKSNPDDASIMEVAAREAAEETNAQILDPTLDLSSANYETRLIRSKDYILRLMQNPCTITVCNKRAKYALFIVPIGNAEWDFGDHEIHPKFVINRSIDWMSQETLVKKNIKEIHPRIRNFVMLMRR